MPGRGVDSPPGRELLGVITSHGPSRESYTPSRKSRGWPAEAIGPPAANAYLSAERMRAALSSSASAPALLQRALPGGGAEMGAVEGAATIPGDGAGPTETERAKPALSGALQKAENTRSRGSYRPGEGNHYRTFFSTIAATGRAATSDSCASGEVLYSASAPTPAGARWSASENASGVGNRRAI